MNRVLDSDQIKALADEESVRGVLVRMALQEAEGADRDELELLEQALELLLSRFQSLPGDTS